MPEYVYVGPGERFYPEARDAEGRNVGAVQPGERREFAAPPDQWWAPADPGSGGDGPGGSEGAAGDPDGTAQDENPETSTPGE